MLRPRIIPCLLVHRGGLVKSTGFTDHKYIGDPINAVRIFNEKRADELIVLDIDATVVGHEPNYELVRKLAAECRMPLCYGGGISTVEQASRLISLGVEKVSIGAAALADPALLGRVSRAVGRQSVVAVLDLKKRRGLFGGRGHEVCAKNATETSKADPLTLARQYQDAGAGEILVNSVDLDGTMKGYDLEMAEKMSSALTVPVTFLGGAGSLDHLGQLISRCGVVGAAAGSLFVFKGKYRAVLINYPDREQKERLIQDSLIEKRN